MTAVVSFIAWTFVMYWAHRVVHAIPFLKKIHYNHHAFVSQNNVTRWHWSNLFLFNDNAMSTIDLWLSDVIPTLVFSAITGQWWIAVMYYVWAAFIQERVEHNNSVNLYPWITSGRWHLIHHRVGNKNYGLFVPIWDKLFNTEQKIKG